MSISRPIQDLKEPLDVDIQLMAVEMDASAKNIRFISCSILTDALAIECFNSLIDDIENEGAEILSLSDNAVMYEYLDEAVIVYTSIGEKFLLFDRVNTRKIERHMHSYL